MSIEFNQNKRVNMKKQELIDTISNICDEKNKRVQGYVFLLKKNTQILWIEKEGQEKTQKKIIELEPFEFAYESTLSIVLPFDSMEGRLSWDTSKLV